MLENGIFTGHLPGGANRNNVCGTRTYRSGYPYGRSGYHVADRLFPFFFFSIPIQYNYHGDDEYAKVSDAYRPGGNLVAATIRPSYATSSVTYRLLGDNSSVSAVFAALFANCSVANNTDSIYPFTPSSTSSTTNTNACRIPDQVIQWYRASSFALSLGGYNNIASLASNALACNCGAGYTRMEDMPLPVGLLLNGCECPFGRFTVSFCRALGDRI